MSRPRISVCVPTHDIPEREYFLSRIEKSLERQSFQNFELVITDKGKIAENSNAAIKKAKGEIVKLLYMDDYLYSHDALKHIDERFTGGWVAQGCVHDDATEIYAPHNPYWNSGVPKGENTIGSPSVVAFANDDPFLFDENLSWLLDCELYGRLYKRYGPPTLISDLDIAIGIGPHQTTNIMTDEEKRKEFEYITT